MITLIVIAKRYDDEDDGHRRGGHSIHHKLNNIK